MSIKKNYIEERIAQILVEMQNPLIKANLRAIQIKEELLKEFREALKKC